MQSPEPGAHVLNARAFRIELEFRNVGFCGEGKTGVRGEKPLRAEKRTNNKLNPPPKKIATALFSITKVMQNFGGQKICSMGDVHASGVFKLVTPFVRKSMK